MANNTNYTVRAEQLTEGSQILVSGKLSFSRLARAIDGDALVEHIARARARGQKHPTTKPHTTVTITDAQVLPAVAGQHTLEEQFVFEHFYTVGQGENAGKTAYGIDNLGTKLPNYFAKQADGTYTQVKLERDLAVGLDVLLVLNVFKSANFDNRGIGIAEIYIQEPIRYYGGGSIDRNALAARGIVVVGAVQTVDSDDLPPIDAPVDVNQDAYVAPPTSIGAPAVIPAPAPAPIPVAAPVQTAPALPVVPQPVQPAAPVAAPAPAQPAVAAETQAEKIARLEAELAARRAANAATEGAGGGASAFDPVPSPSPWEAGVPAGISFPA